MKPTRASAVSLGALASLVMLVGVLLASTACTSSSSCVGKNCRPPATPRFVVHLSADGKPVPRPAGGSRRTPIKIGHPVNLSVSIDRASGVDVRDVYLVVNSYPSGMIDGAAPSGRVKVLAHHVRTLPPGELVEATWTATPLFGTDKLDVTVDFTIADAGIGWTAGELLLTP